MPSPITQCLTGRPKLWLSDAFFFYYPIWVTKRRQGTFYYEQVEPSTQARMRPKLAPVAIAAGVLLCRLLGKQQQFRTPCLRRHERPKDSNEGQFAGLRPPPQLEKRCVHSATLLRGEAATFTRAIAISERCKVLVDTLG